MKNLTIPLILSTTMFFACTSTQHAFDSKGTKHKLLTEYATITFDDKNTVVVKDERQEFAGLGVVLTAVTNIGFNFVDSLLKGRVKQYSSEFTAHQIYDKQDATRKIPGFTIYRHADIGGTEQPLKLEFAIKEFGTALNTFYYELISMKYDYSRARVKAKDRLDYTVELKPTFRVEGKEETKKETIEMKPLQITGVPFGDNKVQDRSIRSETFIAPNGAIFLELDVKVSETNQRSVKAQTILEHWTKNQEELKKTVQSFIPQSKGDAETASVDSDASTGNGDKKKTEKADVKEEKHN